MLRTAATKVAWVGRTASMVFGLALVLALLFGVASMAFASNGQNFIIGNGLADTVKNIATLPTKLTMKGTASGPALQVTQKSTNSGASGVGVTVPSGKAPITVNSTAGKATNLNADKVDGLEPSQIKGAKAYTQVNAYAFNSPTLTSSTTSGFTSVELIDTGTYCLTAPGLTPANNIAVVSVEWAGTSNPESAADAFFVVGGCGDGRFRVITERMYIENGVLSDQRVNNVSFTIAVP